MVSWYTDESSSVAFLTMLYLYWQRPTWAMVATFTARRNLLSQLMNMCHLEPWYFWILLCTIISEFVCYQIARKHVSNNYLRLLTVLLSNFHVTECSEASDNAREDDTWWSAEATWISTGSISTQSLWRPQDLHDCHFPNIKIVMSRFPSLVTNSHVKCSLLSCDQIWNQAHRWCPREGSYMEGHTNIGIKDLRYNRLKQIRGREQTSQELASESQESA